MWDGTSNEGSISEMVWLVRSGGCSEDQEGQLPKAKEEQGANLGRSVEHWRPRSHDGMAIGDVRWLWTNVMGLCGTWRGLQVVPKCSGRNQMVLWG